VENVLKEYAGAHTFTVQSAFKYDYPPDTARKAVSEIKNSKEITPEKFDFNRIMGVVDRYKSFYQSTVSDVANVINRIAKYVPSRRKRKPHVGLFGYSRGVNGIKLPRAIRFTASMYSIGFPPEILGIDALSKEDFAYVKTVYKNFEKDLRDALKFYNPDSPYVPQSIRIKLKELIGDFEINSSHRDITRCILRALAENRDEHIGELILNAASLRKFLG